MLDAPASDASERARHRSVAQVGFVHGARGMLIGSVLGAAVGFVVGRSSAQLSGLGTITSFAILFGFIFVPASLAAIGVARSSTRDLAVRPSAALVIRGTLAAVAAGTGWGTAGSGAAYLLGSAGHINFDLRSLLILGIGFGSIVGGLAGLATTVMRLRR